MTTRSQLRFLDCILKLGLLCWEGRFAINGLQMQLIHAKFIQIFQIVIAKQKGAETQWTALWSDLVSNNPCWSFAIRSAQQPPFCRCCFACRFLGGSGQQPQQRNAKAAKVLRWHDTMPYDATSGRLAPGICGSTASSFWPRRSYACFCEDGN